MDWMLLAQLAVLFFGVALLYASVGFGGGSSYLAVLALFGLEYRMLRAIALICNIVVVSGGTYIFWRKGLIPFRKVIPLVLISVPMAYLGGKMQIAERSFFILLGIVLVVAALLMIYQTLKPSSIPTDELPTKGSQVRSGLLGGGIGWLSGMVGIGGGIFLAPTLSLLKWDKIKKIAATASFFILVNSLSGLMGQLSQAEFQLNWWLVGVLAFSVFVGGQIGSRLGANRLNPNTVKRLMAALILFVGCRILYQQFF